jgi:hypothetical protein
MSVGVMEDYKLRDLRASHTHWVKIASLPVATDRFIMNRWSESY